MLPLEKLTLKVVDIARQAGAYIASERIRFAEERVERKHAHDYVSYVDRQSEQLIVSALTTLLPQAGFIAEEGSAPYQGQEYCWVVDPLDGTTNFIHSFPPYCVSIALCQGTQVLLGVVYEITAAETFYAWKGGGAWLDGRPLQVSSHQLAEALLCLQLPYNSQAYSPLAQHLLSTFYGRAASVRMMGSAAMALCYVAAGRLDGYMERYIGRWDYMAGALIAEEAGGTVTDYGASTHYTQGNSIVATNGIIHPALLQAIEEFHS